MVSCRIDVVAEAVREQEVAVAAIQSDGPAAEHAVPNASVPIST